MSQNIVCVGFKCPVCQRRVVVLRSSDPVPQTATVIVGACRCGFVRPIPMVEVQSLEVRHESETGPPPEILAVTVQKLR